MEAQKDALKTGRIDHVLRALAPHCEAPEASDDQAPVRVCHRYLSARNDHAYWAALAASPPAHTNLNRPQVSENAAA